ncbi:unnamed protein product [Oikopleura dioica]|uniref:Uncharacterized protein n=1 Tax=Oikopleura dioica TaxID=34765 RepID=E4X4T1_OIKDI|nr:unnamed protein product [Oikopleura dioica]
MRLWSLLIFSSFQQDTNVQGQNAVQSIFGDTVEDLAAWIEVLTLSKYFYGDTVSAGNQLIYESRILYDRAMVRFRTVPGSNIPVTWWRGISTEDIIDTKEDLQKYFYAIYRFIARFVDYIEDIAIASCKIEIIKEVTNVIDPLFDGIEDDLLPNSEWGLTILPANFTIQPCAFRENGTKQKVMNQAVKIINAVDWVDDQFDFIELFWKVYGQFFSI